MNVNFMTVCRPGKRGDEAIMAIGIDDEPDPMVKFNLYLLPSFYLSFIDVASNSRNQRCHGIC